VVTTKTLTVKTINIDPAFESAKAADCTLSILYQQDGLSFLVRHSRTRQLLMFGVEPAATLGANTIKSLIDSFSEPLGQICLAVEATNTLMVPSVMSDGTGGNWQKKLLGGAPNFNGASSHLGMKFESVLDEVAQTVLSGSEALHNWPLQMEAVGTSKEPVLHVHVYPSEIFVMASRDNMWQLVNSFRGTHENDLIYHLGNISEQIGWDRAKTSVKISGYSAKAYVKVLEPYFGNVGTEATQGLLQISTSMKGIDPLEHLTLVRL
jgi:hypothetical protein